MRYSLKNMVCDRCKMVVRLELESLGFQVVSISLGEFELVEELSPEQKQRVQIALEKLGFMFIDKRKDRLVEQIKTCIIELIFQNNGELKVNLSDYLSDYLHIEYNYLSIIFSEIEGVTVEKYFISQKIERVKELLAYDELTLSEIAIDLNYSRVAHLSSQFKKITGQTPSSYKKVKNKERKSLDKV